MTLVILESMWGWRAPRSAGARAPQWFTINPENHSGKRLHRLLRVDPEQGDVWVTNACQTIPSHATKHGTPDPAALRQNIIEFSLPIDWLIVGGKVAEATLAAAVVLDRNPDFLVTTQYGEGELRKKLADSRGFFMPHPAARWWSKEMERVTADFLAAPPSLASVPLTFYYVPGPPEHTFRRIGERAWKYEFQGKKKP